MAHNIDTNIEQTTRPFAPEEYLERANDQHVKAVTTYADSDSKLYLDSDKTVGVTKAMLINFFMLGVLTVDAGNGLIIRPDMLQKNSAGSYAYVSYCAHGDTEVEETVYYSSEYSA